jgi:hypothetical protein
VSDAERARRKRAREGTQERLCRPAWPAPILHTGSSDQATSRTRQPTVRPSPADRSRAPSWIEGDLDGGSVEPVGDVLITSSRIDSLRAPAAIEDP